MKVIGRNKIGTETFVPLETILEREGQTYSSDIWPVGVILLQFASKRYSVFSHIRIPHDAKLHTRSTYFIGFIMQLACVFGPQKVSDQLSKWGYKLELPDL